MLMKKILFSLDPERAHTVACKGLNMAYRCGLLNFIKQPQKPCTVMGLTFPNPIGLAAGFDKNGDYIDALSNLGFGFIEIGTVTPKPQLGNPRPRLFRLTEQKAIINRMGFNNKGAEYIAQRLEKTVYKGILGINIGKNKDTPLDNAVEDYLIGFRTFWKFASYITINISSPNTPGLRDLQHEDMLAKLLCVLKQEQLSVQLNYGKYVPLVVKISPDLTQEELYALSHVLLKEKIDGVIATNTSISREGVEHSHYKNEAGGLSGRPLQQRSTDITARLHSILQGQIPIIASGGVMDAAAVRDKMNVGAQLVQVYSGFIYSGMDVVKRLLVD
jgi:dihydroorotate dehydrogenase